MAEKGDSQLNLQGHMAKLQQQPDGRCRKCGTPVKDASHSYCTICGIELPRSGRVAKMTYKAIRLSENGKALVCPHCDNEELTPGDFCMICGRNIVNRCADIPDKKHSGKTKQSCQTVLPGNARYCSKCGNESTFYQNGWLRDWRSENTKRAIENINMAVDITEIQVDRKQG